MPGVEKWGDFDNRNVTDFDAGKTFTSVNLKFNHNTDMKRMRYAINPKEILFSYYSRKAHGKEDDTQFMCLAVVNATLKKHRRDSRFTSPAGILQTFRPYGVCETKAPLFADTPRNKATVVMKDSGYSLAWDIFDSKTIEGVPAFSGTHAHFILEMKQLGPRELERDQRHQDHLTDTRPDLAGPRVPLNDPFASHEFNERRQGGTVYWRFRPVLSCRRVLDPWQLMDFSPQTSHVAIPLRIGKVGRLQRSCVSNRDQHLQRVRYPDQEGQHVSSLGKIGELELILSSNVF